MQSSLRLIAAEMLDPKKTVQQHSPRTWKAFVAEVGCPQTAHCDAPRLIALQAVRAEPILRRYEDAWPVVAYLRKHWGEIRHRNRMKHMRANTRTGTRNNTPVRRA